MSRYLQRLVVRTTTNDETTPLVPAIRAPAQAGGERVDDPFDTSAFSGLISDLALDEGDLPEGAKAPELGDTGLEQDWATRSDTGGKEVSEPELPVPSRRRSQELHPTITTGPAQMPEGKALPRRRDAASTAARQAVREDSLVAEPGPAPKTVHSVQAYDGGAEQARPSRKVLQAQPGRSATKELVTLEGPRINAQTHEIGQKAGVPAGTEKPASRPALAPATRETSSDRRGVEQRPLAQDLHPPTLSTPAPLSQASDQPRVIIGRLSVEVVHEVATPPPAAAVQPAQQTASTQPRSEPTRSKLRFGLGQI